MSKNQSDDSGVPVRVESVPNLAEVPVAVPPTAASDVPAPSGSGSKSGQKKATSQKKES